MTIVGEVETTLHPSGWRVGTVMVGQFFTVEQIAKTMYRLVGAGAGQLIVDPCCGDGIFVKCCPGGARMFACELDDQYGMEVAKRMASGHLVTGDALIDLVGWHGKFDFVVGNPPYSARREMETRPEVLGAYELGRGRSRQRLEVLFLELFVRLAKPGGRIAIILPDGVMGNAPLRQVRAWLLRQGHLELLLGLPRNCFAHTSAKTTVLVLRKFGLEEARVPGPTWMRFVSALEQLAKVARPSKGREHGWSPVSLEQLTDWRPEVRQMNQAPEQEMIPLGSVVKIRRGAAIYGEQRELHSAPAGGRVMLLRAKNVAPGGGLRIAAGDQIAFICRDSAIFCQRALLKRGEIVFVRVGARCYGRSALIPEGLEAQADDWLLVLTPVVSLDAAGLVQWLNSEPGQTSIQRMAKGVGSVSISKSSLVTLPIPSRLIGDSS